MTLAFIIPTLRGGGAERVISRLSTHLAKSQRLFVITWDGRAPAYEFGGTIIDLNLCAARSLLGKAISQRQRCQALADALGTRGIDQAIGFMESAGVPLAMVKSRLMPKLRATVSMRCSPVALGAIARWQVKKWYPWVDRVAMQTNASVQHLISWGIPNERCVVIPNPLPSEVLATATGLTTRDPGLFLAVGRLVPEKDFASLLRAFARITCPMLPRLVILGDGTLHKSLAALAVSLGIDGRVELRGHVADVMSWMDRAGTFVISSRHEGFPNALAEAMARGCPVISTDCPTGPGEMIEHGRSGWLVPVGDVAALANAMTEAMCDRRRADQFACSARQRAEDWAIERIAHRWIADG